MKINLDNIINECIENILFEKEIKTNNDIVIKSAQDKVVNYLKNLIDSGDEKTIELMKNMGYTNDYTKSQMKKLRGKAYNGLDISKELTDDVLKTVKILSKYTMPHGRIDFDGLKRDYSSDYYLINRMKNFIDRKGLTYLYDKSANIPTYSYGINWAKGENEDMLNFNSITDSEANKFGKDNDLSSNENRVLMKMSIVDKYMEAKYGMKFEAPKISFSNGNKKLPDNTLIINFTSALNCPAWNECLVRHACYARAGEKINSTVFNANENKSLYWLSTQNDNQLLNLLFDFIRSYCFDYSKIANHLIKNKLKEGDKNTIAIELSQKSLDDEYFSPEIIDIMKLYKRIDYIRLNENGDFVGEWLVNAWDNEANKYKPYDIYISAYTCRHFNFEGIKNIILNTSYTDGKGNIARHFIALPPSIYTALDETYGGKNNNLNFNEKTIKPNPQPLYTPKKDKQGNITMIPNGKVYYKCPCGRKEGKKEINCYQCNLCYQPKSSENDFYVFVAAHGGSKENLNGYDLIKSNIGVSKNFFNSLNTTQLLKNETENLLPQKLKIAETNGIKHITNNSINSLYKHFKSPNNINESYNINWLN